MGCEESIRRELALLARRKRARVMWSKWRPQEVMNPETNQQFTDEAAWQFVADCLEAGDEVEPVPLRIPSGKTGYVLKRVLSNGVQLYVKLQLGSGVINGRSFHESVHQNFSKEESDD